MKQRWLVFRNIETDSLMYLRDSVMGLVSHQFMKYYQQMPYAFVVRMKQ